MGLLQSTQRDDLPTKGPRRCGGYTSSVGCADTFPSKGKATAVRHTSSDRLTAATVPSKGKARG